MNNLGLYVHVPFCDGKCPYCDFYSLVLDEGCMEEYTARLEGCMEEWGARLNRPVSTVYFGGGTPNLLGEKRLGRLLAAISRAFFLYQDAEVTVEANPTHVDRNFFAALRGAGFNRLSMGLQSADEGELRLLGRRHSPGDAERAVESARAAGFSNISLDLMLGLPGGDVQKLGRSIAFAAGLGVEHISSYILKVEEGTAFSARKLPLPDEDETADQYLFCVEELAARSFSQYEISNFAKPGKESRHNLVYWQGEEYLGLGPGAHSFVGGRRFYYPRDLAGFLRGNVPVEDGEGGGFAEYAMLNLRLTRGLRRISCEKRFGDQGRRLFAEMLERAKNCPPGLLRAGAESLSFTPQGFLVSNALLARLLPEEL